LIEGRSGLARRVKHVSTVLGDARTPGPNRGHFLDASQVSHDGFLVVLGGKIESCLSVGIRSSEACAVFEQEFHHRKRGISLAGLVQRGVFAFISEADLGAVIDQPPGSDGIAWRSWACSHV
jgi:hypothetical protein